MLSVVIYMYTVQQHYNSVTIRHPPQLWFCDVKDDIVALLDEGFSLVDFFRDERGLEGVVLIEIGHLNSLQT